MALTGAQVRGKIKNIAKSNRADARILMRIYMMERLLERVANSPYSENFIIKGGILVTSMIGISMRSTMDIDTSIRNLNLSEEEALRIINKISKIDLQDGVTFNVKDVTGIMDDMEYPGIRVTMDAYLGKMIIPIKIDIRSRRFPPVYFPLPDPCRDDTKAVLPKFFSLSKRQRTDSADNFRPSHSSSRDSRSPSISIA